uniref:Uncharacterized protein n=1 Tax=Arundo donax TaxID=35708 RepID=A0A0A9G6N1_ARUDO
MGQREMGRVGRPEVQRAKWQHQC